MAFVSEGKADLKKFQKHAMLKDYLLSSSSSNGFVSFPRHPAATLLPMPPSRSGGSCAASALRRASERVINAVKRIPFYSVISPSSSSARPKQTSSILRRSLSQRLKRRFWKRKKTDAAIRKSCSCKGSLLLENSNSSSMSSCSWLGSDCSSAQSSSGSSEYFGGSEGIFGKNDQLTPCSNRSTQRGGFGDDSTGGETKQKEEQQQSLEGIAGLDDGKEQLSPVSVLNRHACDDEESPSPTSPINEEENHNNQIHTKFRLFRIASQMGPTNLYNQFFSRSDVEEDEKSNKIAANAKDLLDSFRASHVQARKGSAAIDRLMLEFFREGWWKGEEKLLGAASSWMRDGVTGLGVEDNKEAYVVGMEEGGRWRGFALEEDELVLETEAWLLVSLLEELTLDLL